MNDLQVLLCRQGQAALMTMKVGLPAVDVNALLCCLPGGGQQVPAVIEH